MSPTERRRHHRTGAKRRAVLHSGILHPWRVEYGNRSYLTHNADLLAALTAFLGQFCDDKDPPAEVLLSDETEEQDFLASAVRPRRASRGSAGRSARRKLPRWRCTMPRRRWPQSCGHQLATASSRNSASCSSSKPPAGRGLRYLHIQGRHAVGGMIVAGPEGSTRPTASSTSAKTGSRP